MEHKARHKTNLSKGEVQSTVLEGTLGFWEPANYVDGDSLVLHLLAI